MPAVAVASATAPATARVMVASSVTPAVAAVVAVARAAVVIAEPKIHFDRRTDIGGIAATVIRIVARVRRPIHRASSESGSQQESGRASFQHTYASSSHLCPLTVNLSPV